MRKLILVAIMVCATMPGWAGEDVAGRPPIEAGQTDEGGKKKTYVTDRYTVSEETKTVQEALNVFKRKARPSSSYKKNIRIYDSLNPDNESFLSFMTNDENADITFSPDDDFVYYVAVGADGSRRLRGYSIESHRRFSVNDDIDRFFIQTCEDAGTSYLVVLDRQGESSYSIYDLDGNALVLPDMPADVDDLKNFICY